MQALELNGEWEDALVFRVCFESTKISDCSVWVFERNARFTNRLLLDFFHIIKCASKDFVYLIIHSSFFMRGWVGICRGLLHI
jgi:hypothetical protein